MQTEEQGICVSQPELDDRKRRETNYRHEAFEDATRHIRLLQYTRVSDRTTLRFELNQWLLDDCPAFFAISYCWGDVSNTGCVLINGQKFVIGANALYALVQATDQQKGEVGYYWIDTICINQNNLEEKSHQVRRMASIYGQALQVYSCVGPGDENSGLMFSVLKAYFEDLDTRSRGDLDRPTKRLRKYMDDLPPGSQDLQRLGAAMNNFLDVSYISRLWIVQECTAADPPPLVLWGRHSAPATWWQCMDLRTALVHHGLVPEDKQPPFLVMGIRMEYRVLTFGEPLPPKMRWTLPSIVMACKDFECKDPKDSVYGVCSFVRLPSDMPSIVVDYMLSVEQLFLRLLPYYLAEHGELGRKALAILSRMIGLQLSPEQYRRLEGFHCLECAKRFLHAPSRPHTGPGCDIPQLFDTSSTTHPVYGPPDHQCRCLGQCPRPWAPGLSRLDDESRQHLLEIGCLPTE